MQKFDLSGRAAFVTGGGRGIGLCAAEALLETGARVVISDIDASLLESAKAALAGRGEIEAAVPDITDAAAVGAAAREANVQRMCVSAPSTSSSPTPGPTQAARS